MNEESAAAPEDPVVEIQVPPKPPLPPTSPSRWSQWPAPQRAILMVTASVAILAIIGTITATAFAVRHYDDWAVVAQQRDERTAAITELEEDLARMDDDLASAREALEPQRDLAQRESEITRREGDIQAREDAVKTREDAVTTTEQRIKATSLTNGMYTVGVSMEPGTYRTENTNDSCYWAIYTSGTNYDDIVQNDLGSTGTLTVTISNGQDFETARCGTWVKIG